MATFSEANQAKLSLKMMLHFYSFFNSIAVITEDTGYGVMVFVDKIDTKIKKIIPTVHKGVSIQISNTK